MYQSLEAYKALLSTSLVEDSRSDGVEMVDPELVSLRTKLATVESELATLQMEKFYVGCDYKELCDKMELLERIKTQLHQPEIEFTLKLQHAMEVCLSIDITDTNN